MDRRAVRVALKSLPSFRATATSSPLGAPSTEPSGNPAAKAGSRYTKADSPACTGVKLVDLPFGSSLCDSISETRRRAKVAIDLKRRVGVEQVGEKPGLPRFVGSRSDQVLQDPVGVVTIEEALPTGCGALE